jgi:hypothetical protein
MGIARKARNSSNQAEIEHQGSENILNTVHAIAERNHNNVEEFADE